MGADAESPEVSVEALRFVRDRAVVLHVDEFVLERGATTALFGPNGSGKTTLLRLIAGLEAPTAGKVRISGRAANARTSRHRVAFAFQEPVFLAGTVRRNLDLALDLWGVPAHERRPRIEEVSAACRMKALLERPVEKLSRGESQRVNLARALALRAPVTLLDEPLAAVDRATRAQLLHELPDLLQRFAATTLIVTHDREEAFQLADRLAVLIGGVIHATGSKRDVYFSPPDAATAELLGYVVLELEGERVAIPEGALRIGGGADSFEATVDGVVDMGSHREMLATTGGQRIRLSLPPDASTPVRGDRVRVTAERSVRLPGSAAYSRPSP